MLPCKIRSTPSAATPFHRLIAFAAHPTLAVLPSSPPHSSSLFLVTMPHLEVQAHLSVGLVERMKPWPLLLSGPLPAVTKF